MKFMVLHGRLFMLVVLTLAGAVVAHADSGVPASADNGSKPHARQHVAGKSLDDRVKLMTVELDLDAGQQAALRRILLDQREQVTRVWNDSTVSASIKVATTQQIGDRTADQIRALLNDEQKEKYIKPKQPRDAAEDSAQPNVESWMNTVNSK